MDLNYIKSKISNIITTPLELANQNDIQETLKVWWFSLTKVPLLFAMRPVVKELSSELSKIQIKLTRKNRNHVGSMYFASIMGGADLACGLLALHILESNNLKASPIFKAADAKFLKRIEADAIFVCADGPKIEKMVQKAKETGERQNLKSRIDVFAPDQLGDEVAAIVHMTLSIKVKSSNKNEGT